MADHGLPCVHCGLCLDSCPTYRLLGVESESPRGRLYLMDAITKGEMALDADAAGHLSRCLGCLACEAACPSGVDYGHRIEEVRPLLAARTAYSLSVLALAPVVFAGLAIIAASLNGVAAIPLLAGAALLAAGLAFLQEGAQAGLFLLCAAALVGLARPSALAVHQQRHARRGAAVSGFH